jgi:hypothetical protein
VTFKIAEDLTESEKLYLERSSNSSGGRIVRLSIQYAVGAGIFVYLCLSANEPLYVLPVYGVLISVLIVRVVGAFKARRSFKGIIEKYEAKLQDLPEK